MRKMNKKIIISIILIIVIIGILIGAYYLIQKPKYTGPVEKIRLGAPAQGPDLSLLIWIAEDQGYFVSNRLDVNITSPPTTLKIQQELNDGELDLGVSTEFAYITPILNANPLKAKIIATINRAKTIEIISRKDRGISSPTDLKGKKIAVFKNTPQEFFLGVFLISNNLNIKDVQLVNLPPANASDAILSGDVDAAVMSEPYIYQTKKALAENAVSWPVQGDTDFNWIIAGNDQFIKDHPAAMERFLKALVQAEEYVQKNPDKSQELLAKKFNLEQPYLVSVWPKYKFSVSLYQSLLLTMESESRWSISNNLTNATEVPNYLNYIYIDALKKVKPEAVTIIGE